MMHTFYFMGRAFKRLQRVLELEVKQGYKDKAVVGGIRQFAMFWVGQARQEAVDEADRGLVEQTAEVLMDYGRLPGIEARAKAITGLLERLQTRRKRTGTAPSAEKKEETTEAPPSPATQKRKKPASEPDEKRSETRTAKGGKERRSSAKKAKPTPPFLPNAHPDPEVLQESVTALKGIGPKMAQKLSKLGAETLGDLLYVFPRRYDDYTLMKPINRLSYGEQVTIIGTIWETRARRTRNNQVVVQSIINDGTASIQATWFNQPWLADKLTAGLQVVISGKVDQFLGRPVFQSPEWEPLEWEPLRTRRIVPVYPLTQGLTSVKMRDVMHTAVSKAAPCIPDPLPEPIRQRHNLYSLPQAIYQVHYPDSQQALHEARRRLTFDELFLLQLGMQKQRYEWQSVPGIPLTTDPATLIRFRNMLPFQLTTAQQRVIEEIATSMAGENPMNRLLQGDVGAGKTVVAAAALLIAVKAQTQAALMAPTEILAEQHFQGLNKLLAPLDVSVGLLTGSTPAAEKAQLYADLESGSINVIIGTHALIQERVKFDKLGLAVIDEQHRFGVDQRQALRFKGSNGHPNPHLLVMSATPIPRTLALSIYGDLDLSILDEMPPGRQEIKTRWLRTSERERAYAFVRSQIEQGRQAYIICPLVEESDKIDAKSAVEEHNRLQTEVFPDLRVGLIHGRLKADEKEAVMRTFYNGELDILVATSVIEVGVDVPNSTVMVIEGANRFGLAQLHQFRGRVGRGQHQSYCLLIADSSSTDAEERLSALEKSNDGFALAEKDLEIRGPGEFFGRRQSGIPELQLASLLDMNMVEITKEEATSLYQQDPLLEQPDHQLLQERIAQFWQEAGDVS